MDRAEIRGSTHATCERCRRRKIRCDRTKPCNQCKAAKTECISLPGERKRNISKQYVEALEGQIESLEVFIKRLKLASSSERDHMLSNFESSQDIPFGDFNSSERSSVQLPISHTSPRSSDSSFLRLKRGNAAHFYGATSFFQIRPPNDNTVAEDLQATPTPFNVVNLGESTPASNALGHDVLSRTQCTPKSAICQQMLSLFFQHQYYYHMVVYREYFLKDYDAGKGPYYSDLLLYAICAMGALASEVEIVRDLSDLFVTYAEDILHTSSILESPDLTALQALLILGQLAIGRGKNAKGWLFTGLAFRLVQEMGLHLDPDYWRTVHESDGEREILRRVYWACFIADKQVSLYFGRPFMLSPLDADIDDAVRIPYLPEWESLLNIYIKKDTNKIDFEDGIAFTSTFIEQAKLCKIIYHIPSQSSRKHAAKSDDTTSNKNMYISMTKWLTTLPAKLQWNHWMRDQVPAYVLHLQPEDLEICDQSLLSILQLLKVYYRYYGFAQLPVTFVHTAATATSVILLKRWLQRNDADETATQLDQISRVVDGLAISWSTAKHIQVVIKEALDTESRGSLAMEVPPGYDWDAAMGFEVGDFATEHINWNEYRDIMP